MEGEIYQKNQAGLGGDPIPRALLSVVIPCFNEEEVLPATLERVSAVCREQSANFEIIAVDDGSGDRTWEILRNLRESYPELVAARLSRNFGHQSALTAALHLAQGDRVLIIDADLQDPPELLPEMMARMDEGYHVVYGQRSARDGETWMKKFTAASFYWAINALSDIAIPQNTGDFRLISRTALDAVLQLPEHNRFLRGMFTWVGLPQISVIYRRAPRHAGRTKYNYRRMLSFAVDGITGFSIRPLKIALLMAFVMTVCGVLGAIWTIYSWDKGGTERGWASIMTACFLIGSCQLFVLGIIGEYLGRLFIEAKRRPAYILQEVHRREA